jgi:ATP-dependent Clp protease ATP-binding subunit ClpA
MKELKKKFRPEFINRLDEIITFNYLEESHVLKIIDIFLNELKNTLADKGFKIKFNKGVKNFLLEKGYDKSFGARPLKRTITKYLETPLTDTILKAENEPELITISLVDDKLSIELS